MLKTNRVVHDTRIARPVWRIRQLASWTVLTAHGMGRLRWVEIDVIVAIASFITFWPSVPVMSPPF